MQNVAFLLKNVDNFVLTYFNFRFVSRPHWKQIGISLKQLTDDCLFWIEKKTYSEEEIAVRFKHKIVKIHCFPNGNGRHSRLMADVIVNHIFGKPVFTWSRANLNKRGEQRTNYLKAIKEADKDNIKLLMKFAKT